MNILFITVLPPPVNGQSLLSKLLFDHLNSIHEIATVNCAKQSFLRGVDGIKRILKVAQVVVSAWWKNKTKQAVYVTISESFFGNLKDILICSVWFKYLETTYIHLHEGSIKRLLRDKHPVLFSLNKLFIRRLGGTIVSGHSHESIFQALIDPQRIHIVANVVQEFLFIDPEIIEANYAKIFLLQILYMSSFQPKKGYQQLLNAFFQLNSESQNKVIIHFAG